MWGFHMKGMPSSGVEKGRKYFSVKNDVLRCPSSSSDPLCVPSGTLRTSRYNFTIQLRLQDSTTPLRMAEGSQSIIAALELVQNRSAQAIIGEPFSTNTLSSALVSSRFGIPQCSGSASTDELNNRGSYGLFFRAAAANSHMARLYVKTFIEHYGWKRFALLYSR